MGTPRESGSSGANAGHLQRSGGIHFTRSERAIRQRQTLVMADVRKLDQNLSADTGYHVGPGGSGPSAIRGRYGEAKRFLSGAKRSKSPVHATEVSISRKGQASIEDGRHRFAVLRDKGLKKVPVSVPRSQAARFRKLFGAK